MLPAFLSFVSVAAVVLGVAGLVTIAVGFRRLSHARASRRWPQVKGVIVSAKVEQRADSMDDKDGNPREVTLFHAAITYTYPHAGQTLTGDRVSVDELESSDRSQADSLVTRFRPGQPVDVWVNPANPSEAVLEPGITGGSMLFPLVGAALVVLSVGMAVAVLIVNGRFNH